MTGSGRVARWIVRIAALRAPRGRREEMVAEWDAELARAVAGGGRWSVVVAALGAFSDARALRGLDYERRDPMMGRWGEEIRIAVRSLGRTPGFTAVCVLTLAVGLGGVGAVYTLLDRIVLDPLPYPDSERLVRLQNRVPGVGPDAVWQLSTAQYVFYDEHVEALSAVGLHRRLSGANVMTSTGPQRARLVRITPDVISLLGAEVQLGRGFVPDDGRPGAERVILLSDGFWRRTLGADPDVVGQALSLDGRPVEVVGVLGPDVRPPGGDDAPPDIWEPLVVDPAGPFRNTHLFSAVGRLSEGSTVEALEAELDRLIPRLTETFPDVYPAEFFERYGFRTFAEPLKESVVRDMRQTLWVLFGGVFLVLAVAAANVSNLFLVRVEGRRRELAVRRALGADRRALARYVLAESLVLAGAGGLLAVAGGVWAVPALVRLAPDGLPRIDDVALGGDTAVLTLLVALGVGLVVSVYPLVSRAPDEGELAAGDRRASHGPGRRRASGVLVVGQMALAIALIVGAGLLMESLRVLQASDPGFEPEGVLAVELHASPARYPDDIDLWDLHGRILERVRAIPGVAEAGMGEVVPVTGGYGCTVQGFADQSVYERIEAAGMTTCAGQQHVTPGYFQALGIPLLEGRLLDAGDSDDPTRHAVVVSRAFAERFWPDGSAIGRRVHPNGWRQEPYFEVVGVVGDVARASDPGQPPLSQTAVAIYYPMVHDPAASGWWGWWWPGSTTLVVRADGVEPTSLLPSIRRVVDAIDPEIPLANARAMAGDVSRAMAGISFLSTLMIVAALAALLLAAVGLYGVVSWVVSRRTREIGMRLAIGASPGTVVRAVVIRTLRLALAGLIVGLPLGYLTSRIGQGVLVGVEPTAPAAYIAASGVVGLVSLLAAWIPARRAASVDPATSLRAE